MSFDFAQIDGGRGIILTSICRGKRGIYLTEVKKIIDFLETDTISVTFSVKGLKYLSLKADRGSRNIDFRIVDQKQEQSSVEALVIKETFSFLETGKHSMPLDLNAFTNFQQSVFAAVSRIEPGQVVTYQGIAKILGKPGAVRAVGNAVAKNPVSYFLPTHRVLPKKGLGICRSGAGHLREKLLAREGHDLTTLRGNYDCTRKKCRLE